MVTGGLFTQGSFSYQTVTRPLKEDADYDVDVVLPINANVRPDDKRDPEKVLDYVKSRLDTYPSYAGKVRRRYRCVRINYAGDFHLDLVPAHGVGASGTGCWIPDVESRQWIKSHPAEYTAWVKSLNGGRARFRLTRTVKMLKRWRDATFAADRAPSSIILTTLAGYLSPATYEGAEMPFPSAYASSPSDASFLVDTVRLMEHRLNELPGGLKLTNPVWTDEDLARDWSREDYTLFRTRLATLSNRVTRAYSHPDRERSVALWQEAFPIGFPSRA